jgi:hypothetical protein
MIVFAKDPDEVPRLETFLDLIDRAGEDPRMPVFDGPVFTTLENTADCFHREK